MEERVDVGKELESDYKEGKYPFELEEDQGNAESIAEEQKIDWPKPDRDMFYGLAGALVKAIEPHSEADPVALLTQFIVGFGNTIGRGPYFEVEADRHYTNIFMVLVGPTAKGRKGASWGHIKRPFKSVSPEWVDERIHSGLSSGEGLIWSVRDPIEKTEPIRDKKTITGYQDVIIDQGIDDKRLLVTEAEFASTLRVIGRDGNILSAVMRQGWDTGYLRVMTKNTPAKATKAHISIIGHITKEELIRYLTSTEAGNGFANRFLWLCVRRSKCLSRGGRIQSVNFEPILKRLKHAVEFASMTEKVEPDNEAWEVWDRVYPDLSEGKPGLLGAVTSRAEAQVMRIACIYALLDCTNTIKAEHLKAALALWDYCYASAQYIFGDSLGDPMADEILNALKHYPDGLTRTQINNLFGRNKSSQEIMRALGVLESQGSTNRITVDTGGRKAELWIATQSTK